MDEREDLEVVPLSAEQTARALAAQAAAFWRRVAAVMRALEGPDWPYGAKVELRWTRSARPFFRVGEAGITLEDELCPVEDDRVVEITAARMRVIGARGVVLSSSPIPDPGVARFN